MSTNLARPRIKTTRHPVSHRAAALALTVAAVMTLTDSRLAGQDGFRFRTGVELINVTATVTDHSGRFVPGLQQSDFVVYEDDRPVEVTHFSAERVPVSLGIVLDTSGSMAGDKLANALGAIERFLDRLLNPDDEIFVYGFSTGVEPDDLVPTDFIDLGEVGEFAPDRLEDELLRFPKLSALADTLGSDV
jgi:hypothetical protein